MKFNTIIRTGVTAGTSLALALGFSACSRDYTACLCLFGLRLRRHHLRLWRRLPGRRTHAARRLALRHAVHQSRLHHLLPRGQERVRHRRQPERRCKSFSVGTDGKLYGENTYNITGTYPQSANIDSSGNFLYVTYKYQLQYSPASPGPGGVSIFKINSDGSLNTPTNVNVGNNPIGVSISTPVCTSNPLIAGNATSACTGGQVENVFVYVVDQETAPNATVLGFYQNTSSGALTLLPGSTCTATAPTICKGYPAGVTPSAIVSDPTGRYVYITDKTSNEIFGYSIGSSSTTATAGILTSLVSSPYTTGLYPVSITIDPRGKYVYTANYNGNSVSSYSLNTADGSLGGTASVGNFTTSTGPTCVTVDPALGQYLYTSNYLDGSISGGQLSANTGALTAIQNTPFPAGNLPSCITSVPNGPRANQLYNP